ncbi:YiiX/YebB-like N1pC/P60 family cysteine hydrolase [Stenoxybacter acetivorans]|uniref:YiiX/YebB-like N1pC/P60 family cysteine hydrolase n=1 Tax=Stenoxybacter acetivorans TaxID=422441 RepID=UPI00147044B5|nr:YiiX/YebB-like N1pC/P60 family cysteine hydrolase [Stenoxybacter acetivorans]
MNHLKKCTRFCQTNQRVFWIGVLLFGLVAAAVAAWRFYAKPPSFTVFIPPEVSAEWQAGDVIFRIGTEWQSDAVRLTAEKRGDPFSHVGILVGSPGNWQVIHAVPAEVDGRKDAVVQDDLAFYLAPERAVGVAVYRVQANAVARLAAVNYARTRLGEPFRIVENDKLGQYCTTLVWAAWQYGGVDLGVHFDYLDIPFVAGHYLMPNALRKASGLTQVFISMP